MSPSEVVFLARMTEERILRERRHCKAIRAANGDCKALDCADCPLECSMVETDDITWRKAEEWLAANP